MPLSRLLYCENIVAAWLADKAEIQIAYAIGVARPVSLMVNTFGTGKYPDKELKNAVKQIADLRPAAIIEKLKFQRPIYKKTAACGHFGRNDDDFTWERTDSADQFQVFFKERT